MRTTWTRWLPIAVLLAGWCAACAGAPVTPEQRRLAEARLLEPFLRGTEVGCAELELEVTGNFHNHIGQPAVDPTFHKVARTEGTGFREVVWTSLSGDPKHSFTVTVGEPVQLTEQGLVQKPRTTFRVVNQVRLRIHEDRRPLQISATASGFVLVREAKGSPREVSEFAVVDGVLHVR